MSASENNSLDTHRREQDYYLPWWIHNTSNATTKTGIAFLSCYIPLLASNLWSSKTIFFKECESTLIQRMHGYRYMWFTRTLTLDNSYFIIFFMPDLSCTLQTTFFPLNIKKRPKFYVLHSSPSFQPFKILLSIYSISLPIIKQGASSLSTQTTC